MDYVEVVRPPVDSGAFVAPDSKSPAWKPTVRLLRADLLALRGGDHGRLWACLLTHKMTPTLEKWLSSLAL